MTGAYPGRGLLCLADEVETAIRCGGPVVALESNVITHGLPYPENAETARTVERAVRATGAVPATVCVDGGAIKIGMTDDDIERFARGASIPKVSSRDLPAGLRHHFELVVGADSVRCPKPDAEAALLVSQVLVVEPAHAIVVGDTTTDLRMAKNAGMRSVGVTYGIHDTSQLATADPTWLADSFDAAVKLILGAG